MLAANRIYLQYKSKEITTESACSLLLAEIFKSPKYYGIGDLNEDETSSFLIWIHNHIPGILDRCNLDESTFITYFTITIRLRYKSWRREIVKQEILRDVLDHHHFAEFMENGSGGFDIRDPAPAYFACPRQDIQLKRPLSTKQATTILVLALRSIHHLPNSIIERIPRLTGMSPEKFYSCAEKIASHIKKKRQLNQKLERRINSTYILCRQHEHELSAMDSTMSQYHIVAQQYHYRKKVLEKLRNDKNRIRMYPSNRIIEEVLCLPQGSVRRILIHAEKHIAQIRNLLDLEKS